MKKLNFYFISLFLLLLVACNGENTDENPMNSTTVLPTGKISGKVVANNGTKEIGGALIFTFDQNDKMYFAYSDASGNFTFDAPAGQRIVHIQTGTGANFRTEVSVNIKKDEITTIPITSTKLTQVAKMAYVAGSYDKIEDIVTSLGYTITQISYNDLKNMNEVKKYDAIFLNCGSRTATSSADTIIDSNLSTFVSNGGSLYASDWSVAYLIGGNSNTTACGATGGFIPDSKLCSIDNGSAQTISNTTVSDPALATALGFSTLNIQYDLGAWQKIVNYDASFWNVMVQNGTEALMMKTNQYFDPNAPVIGIGNDATDNYLTICHHPNGATPITITINASDWAAHQLHGDTLGACSGSATSGNIFYTTFHNHASGNIGNAGLILQYIILNL